MKTSTKFPCTKCGECCRNIANVPELEEYDLGNGVCKFLVGNICSIYNSRPDICRVDKMYDDIFHIMFTKEEFYRLNIDACEWLKSGTKE